MNLIYGKHAVEAALKNPKRFCKTLYVKQGSKFDQNDKDLLSLCAHKKKPALKKLSDREFTALLDDQAVHQGIAAEVDALPHIDLDQFLKTHQDQENLNLLVLDQVTDPYNLGAIIRSGAAFNLDAVLFSGHKNSVLRSPVLYKTACGAAEIIPLIEVNNLKQALEKLKAENIWIYGLDERGKTTVSQTDLSGRTALVLGAEGDGLRRLTKDTCDDLIKLPTGPDFFTINVSATAAIMCYEINRQTQQKNT